MSFGAAMFGLILIYHSTSLGKLTRMDSMFPSDSKPNLVDLDLEKLIFPLILRHWHEGEYFQPLGMTGLKKLSDFFIDEKYSIPDKENIWILASGNQVVWIAGKRLDDRYKITSKMKRILRIRLG